MAAALQTETLTKAEAREGDRRVWEGRSRRSVDATKGLSEAQSELQAGAGPLVRGGVRTPYRAAEGFIFAAHRMRDEDTADARKTFGDSRKSDKLVPMLQDRHAQGKTAPEPIDPTKTPMSGPDA